MRALPTWSRAEIRRSWGSLVVVAILIALAVGLPLGVILGRAIWTSIASERDPLVRVDVPWASAALLVAGAIGGAALVLASVPAPLAARRSVARELWSE